MLDAGIARWLSMGAYTMEDIRRMPFVEFAYYARRLDSTGFLLSMVRGASKHKGTPAKTSGELNLTTMVAQAIKQGGGKIRL